MEYEEKDYFQAFGLGVNEQGLADPAPEDPDKGVNEQGLAAPAEVEEQEPGTPEGAQEPEDKPPQTPEQRRENAARRREQERKAQAAAVERAVQEALAQERAKNKAQMDQFFAKAGLKNTVTGQPITNMEQFQAWNDQYTQARLERQLKAGKLTAEGLAQAIGSHPTMRKYQELVEQNEAARKAQAMAAAREKIDGEIAEIGKIDRSIGSLEDLMQATYWPELYKMTQRGYSIKDAHFLLNHKRLEEAKATAARQQAASNARGKEHLTGNASSQGAGSIPVPAAEMKYFRQLLPDVSDAEIQAYYQKYKNRR